MTLRADDIQKLAHSLQRRQSSIKLAANPFGALERRLFGAAARDLGTAVHDVESLFYKGVSGSSPLQPDFAFQQSREKRPFGPIQPLPRTNIPRSAFRSSPIGRSLLKQGNVQQLRIQLTKQAGIGRALKLGLIVGLPAAGLYAIAKPRQVEKFRDTTLDNIAEITPGRQIRRLKQWLREEQEPEFMHDFE